MKVHTPYFKDNICLFGRQLDTKISYTLNNESIELGSEDLNSVSPHYEGGILKSVMRQLDIDSNVSIPVDTEINCQFGCAIGEDENGVVYEYINMGNYVVYSVEKKEDTDSYMITCYDKMILSMVDYSSMSITYPITIRSYINAICTHLGLTFKNASDTFANYNKEIPVELYLTETEGSLGYTFRDVLDELAQVTASTICINEVDDELEIRYITDTDDTIDEEYLKDINVKFGNKFGPVNSIVLSRSGESDNVFLQDEDSVEANGLCEIKIVDNQIMNDNNRSDYLADILEQLDGLEYYENDFTSTGICYYNICDRYNVQIGDNTYSCVMFNDDIQITQGLKELIFTEIPEYSETEYKYASKDDRQRNRAYIIAKKNEAEINALASKIVDISNTISRTHTIQLENAYEGILHRLEITGNISVLYPSNNLYPSNDLYPRICNLLVDETIYDLDFEYLNYINDNVCDKYVYEDGKQWVERNVGVDEYGQKYALSETVIEQGEDINIFVEKESSISMVAFYNAKLNCTYLLENEYTNTFANQVEVTSELNLLGDTLEAKVSSVADDDGNITSASLILAINKDESGATLNADKVNIEANDVLNILAGNEINLTTKNLSINSDNFSVDKDGNTTITSGVIQSKNYVANTSGTKINLTDGVIDTKNFKVDSTGNATMNNANITGGNITLSGDNNTPKFRINNSNPNNSDMYSIYYPNVIRMFKNNLATLTILNQTNIPQIGLFSANNTSQELHLTSIYINITDGTNTTNIQASGITTPTVTQTSLEKYKKNFEKLENAKEILKNTDIYKYNLKSDKDTDKKHIGFVIGDKFNYSKDITSKDNDGVDIYSMVSVLWQVVKEQEEEIKLLKERIDK